MKEINHTDLNGDGIGYLKQFDFSRANISEESRIDAVTTVASICVGNAEAKNKIKLYNRLATESVGIPSSSYEFVPVLLRGDQVSQIIWDSEAGEHFYSSLLDQDFYDSDILKYGEWVEDGKYLLTNLRALLNDTGEDSPKYYNTLEECETIAKHFKVFKAKIDLNTARQYMRHRVIWQEMCVTGDTIIKTTQGKRTIEELYKNQFRRKNDRLPMVKMYDFKSKTFVNSKVKEVFKTGEKEVFEIEIQYGTEGKTRKITTSKDHKFLTKDGWARLEDIVEGDFLAINGVQCIDSKDWLSEQIESRTYKDIALELGCGVETVRGRCIYYGLDKIHIKNLDKNKGTYKDKDWLTKKKEEALLRGVGMKGLAIELGVNYHTLKKWMNIFQLWYTQEETSSTYDAWNKGVKGEESHSFGMVHSVDARKKISEKHTQKLGSTRGGFAKRIRSFWEADFRRASVFEKYENKCSNCGDTDGLELDHILPVYSHPWLGFEESNVHPLCKSCHREKSSKERAISASTIKFGRVHKITPKGKQETYDLEVDHKDHNYVANSIVVHNSRRYVSGKKQPFEFYLSEGVKALSFANGGVQDIIDDCVTVYNEAIHSGVKPQEARRILPQAMYTEVYSAWMPNQLQSYLALRTASGTQDEARELAIAKQNQTTQRT